jgi:hypothetical protein
MAALPTTDDSNSVRHAAAADKPGAGAVVESRDALIARRLDRARVAADLVATLDGIDALERAGATHTFAVVAISFGSWPNAVAFLDGAQSARRSSSGSIARASRPCGPYTRSSACASSAWCPRTSVPWPT